MPSPSGISLLGGGPSPHRHIASSARPTAASRPPCPLPPGSPSSRCPTRVVPASSEHIHHVHAEAASRLVAAALPQVPGVVRRVHRLHDHARIV